jgi:hypothetical protein
MIYVKSIEHSILLPTDSVDILFTLNAIDHVDHFPGICRELLRIPKPGGYFIGSFNLGEPATRYEPQTLDEGIIREHLLNSLETVSYRTSNPGPKSNPYQPFLNGEPNYDPAEPGILWVRARKP